MSFTKETGENVHFAPLAERFLSTGTSGLPADATPRRRLTIAYFSKINFAKLTRCHVQVFCVLAFVFCLLTGLSAVAPAKAEMAEPDKYLPNFSFAHIPAPPDQYATRYVWLLAAEQAHTLSWNPLTRVLAGVDIPRNAKKQREFELETIRGWSLKRQQQYYMAMVGDYTTMELHQLGTAGLARSVKTAIADAAAGFIMTVIFDHIIDQLVEHVRDLYRNKVAIERATRSADFIQSPTREDLEQIMLSSYGQPLEGVQSFNVLRSHLGAQRNLGRRMTFDEAYFEVFGRSLSQESRRAIIDSMRHMEVWKNLGEQANRAAKLKAVNKALKIVIGKGAGDAAGRTFVGSLGDGTAAIIQMRHQALRAFLAKRFGCISPRGNKLAPTKNTALALPETKQNYQTLLGRLLAASPKWGFTAARGPLRFRKELGKVDRLRKSLVKSIESGKPRPTNYAAYLIHFVQDLDTLEVELRNDKKGEYGGFLAGLAQGEAAGVVAVSGAPATAGLSIALGALLAGGLEFDKMNAEQKIIAGVAKLRAKVLKTLMSVPPNAGCKQRLEISPIRVVKGKK